MNWNICWTPFPLKKFGIFFSWYKLKFASLYIDSSLFVANSGILEALTMRDNENRKWCCLFWIFLNKKYCPAVNTPLTFVVLGDFSSRIKVENLKSNPTKVNETEREMYEKINHLIQNLNVISSSWFDFYSFLENQIFFMKNYE